MRDELVALGVAPAERFAVIRVGIDLERRASGRCSAPAPLREAELVVGWAGRMTAIKRVEDAVESVARLRERGVDALLVLVGDGPDRALGRDEGTGARHRGARGVPRHRSTRWGRGTGPSTSSCSRAPTRAPPWPRSSRSRPVPPSSRQTSAACPTSSGRARTASSSPPATSTGSPIGSNGSHATRNYARRMGEAAAPRARARYAVQRLVDGRRPALRRAARRERPRGARPASGAAAGTR